MKKAFTLVEMLIVVVVIVTLMGIVFRLGGAAEGTEARNRTIYRMQRIENCISGYYAAFGSYPPVKLHGSRNIYYKVNKYGIQQTEREDPEPGVFDWFRIEAACRAQPVAMNFPFPGRMQQYVKNVSQTLTELHFRDPSSGYGQNELLANLFDGLENPAMLSQQRGYSAWAKCQVFRFGLMSYLLPRFVVMMGHNDSSIYEDFIQWANNNQMPCRFEDGAKYASWRDLNLDIAPPSANSGQPNKSLWKVEALPTQAICARWIPNLEGILWCEEEELKVFGVTLNAWEEMPNIDIRNPNPVIFSAADSQGGENSGGGSGQYSLYNVSCKDGWGGQFYYYSAPPYQSYRFWSAGPNGKTFPPWISPEEISRDQTLQSHRREIQNWLADDIAHMRN